MTIVVPWGNAHLQSQNSLRRLVIFARVAPCPIDSKMSLFFKMYAVLTTSCGSPNGRGSSYCLSTGSGSGVPGPCAALNRAADHRPANPNLDYEVAPPVGSPIAFIYSTKSGLTPSNVMKAR